MRPYSEMAENVEARIKLRSYNSRLLPIRNKGLCGDAEVLEEPRQLEAKIQQLIKLLRESSRTVVFTGAGVSTSSGIPDFRGPNGVWTREKKKDPIPEEQDTPEIFEKAQPSETHRALKTLLDRNIISHIISQNVDGLHLRSGVGANDLTELHGNIFMEKCDACGREYFRDRDVGGMGCKLTGNRCDDATCAGPLRDCAIDWDTALPEDKFRRARHELDVADLVLCLGTSLRIRPAGLLPLRTVRPKKKRGGRSGKLVIVNLQATDLDAFAALKISHYCDRVMTEVTARCLEHSLDAHHQLQRRCAACDSGRGERSAAKFSSSSIGNDNDNDDDRNDISNSYSNSSGCDGDGDEEHLYWTRDAPVQTSACGAMAVTSSSASIAASTVRPVKRRRVDS